MLYPQSRCETFAAVFAHVAGIPIEETALGFVPVFLAAGGIALQKLRRLGRG